MHFFWLRALGVRAGGECSSWPVAVGPFTRVASLEIGGKGDWDGKRERWNG